MGDQADRVKALLAAVRRRSGADDQSHALLTRAPANEAPAVPVSQPGIVVEVQRLPIGFNVERDASGHAARLVPIYGPALVGRQGRPTLRVVRSNGLIERIVVEYET